MSDRTALEVCSRQTYSADLAYSARRRIRPTIDRILARVASGYYDINYLRGVLSRLEWDYHRDVDRIRLIEDTYCPRIRINYRGGCAEDIQLPIIKPIMVEPVIEEFDKFEDESEAEFAGKLHKLFCERKGKLIAKGRGD